MEVLYHASSDTNLTIIVPKRTISKDIYIGDFVFATQDKRLVAMYLVAKGNATIMDIKPSNLYGISDEFTFILFSLGFFIQSFYFSQILFSAYTTHGHTTFPPGN